MYLKTLKALLLGLCIGAMATISWASSSLAAEESLEQQVHELIQQNKALTDRLMQVEQQLSEMKAKTAPAGVEQRVSQLEERLEKEKPAWGTGFLSDLENRITFSGLLEFGAAYHSTDMNHGDYEHDSDLCMTTVELAIAAEVNDWVSAEMVLLYEDPTFDNDETNVDIDEAFITIGNTERIPPFLKAGKMYVPFGALLEHFPDDPLIDAPLTLCVGETLEKAVLIGAEYEGFTVSAYVFNGDVEEAGGGDNVVESYGFDANYALEEDNPIIQGLDLLVGGSYISNMAEADGIEDTLEDIGSDIEDYVGGAAAYFHAGYQGFFLDAEYMAFTDTAEFYEDGTEVEIDNLEVWNFEIGYNYNWWRNLEIALKYAGSNDCDYLGLPRDRYGINFNQEIFDNTILSVGYMYDEYDNNDADNRNTRDLVFGQIAVEF
ncbi:MAG: LbtU family siderophore porin [Deltaproteobacteria bacterium]|nr:LbtU family siderophore porin [Deltaproteobacteria bacterium]